jgi:hypothetical protein
MRAINKLQTLSSLIGGAIQKLVGCCVQKINLVSFVLGVFMMASTICQAGLHCGAGYSSIPLVLNGFKGEEVYVWTEKGMLRFSIHPAKNAWTRRQDVAKHAATFTEQEILDLLKRSKEVDNIVFFIFIENPDNQSFLDLSHNPMRPREEFSALINEILASIESGKIKVFFSDDKTDLWKH